MPDNHRESENLEKLSHVTVDLRIEVGRARRGRREGTREREEKGKMVGKVFGRNMVECKNAIRMVSGGLFAITMLGQDSHGSIKQTRAEWSGTLLNLLFFCAEHLFVHLFSSSLPNLCSTHPQPRHPVQQFSAGMCFCLVAVIVPEHHASGAFRLFLGFHTDSISDTHESSPTSNPRSKSVRSESRVQKNTILSGCQKTRNAHFISPFSCFDRLP